MLSKKEGLSSAPRSLKKEAEPLQIYWYEMECPACSQRYAVIEAIIEPTGSLAKSYSLCSFPGQWPA
jgi:hypothetical protein